MQLVTEKQVNPIESEVLARISIIRPILNSLLIGIKQEVLDELGGVNNVKLKMLARAYRPSDGDVGFCFEWAVHDAIRRSDPQVMERLCDAAKQCKLPGSDYTSILFGLEKSGKVQVIDTASDVLTDESRILTGKRAQPPKLRSYLKMLSAAFNRPSTRAALPSSISGLWKADLFFGTTDADRWLGTSLKINPNQLEGASGLRIGIVPAKQGRSDRVHLDDKKNIMVCPIPYDGSFMELFYTCWGIVQQFIKAEAHMPKEVYLPVPADRQAVRELVTRRDFPVLEVLDALEPLSQPGLTKQNRIIVDAQLEKNGEQQLNDTIIAPIAQLESV